MEVSSRSAKMLKKAFYGENNIMGRDSLFYILKKQCPKTHPTEDEIETWLKRQEVQQIYGATRKGGSSDRFYPTEPWANISIDLIDFSNKVGPGNMKYILVVIDNFAQHGYGHSTVTAWWKNWTLMSPARVQGAESSSTASAAPAAIPG